MRARLCAIFVLGMLTAPTSALAVVAAGEPVVPSTSVLGGAGPAPAAVPVLAGGRADAFRPLETPLPGPPVEGPPLEGDPWPLEPAPPAASFSAAPAPTLDLPSPVPLPSFPLGPANLPGTYVACVDRGAGPLCAPVPVPLGVPVPLDLDGDVTSGLGGLDAALTLSLLDPVAALQGLAGSGDPAALAAALGGVASEAAGNLTAVLRLDALPGLPAPAPRARVTALAGLPPLDAPPVPPRVPPVPPLPPSSAPPLANRTLLVGFDGLADGLPAAAHATLRLNRTALAAGETRLRFNLTTGAPGASLGLLAATAEPAKPGERTALAVTLAPVPDLAFALEARPKDSFLDLRFAANQPARATVAFDATTVGPATATRAAAEVDALPDAFALTLSLGKDRGRADYAASAPVGRVAASLARTTSAGTTAASASVENLPQRLSTTYDLAASPAVVRYDAAAPLGPVAFDLASTPPGPALRARVASLPGFLQASYASGFVEVDARASAGAPPGSGSLGRIEAAFASDGQLPTGQPPGDHLTAVQAGSAVRGDLVYEGLRYLSADVRNDQAHLRLRNTAPRVFAYAVAVSGLAASGRLEAVPASVDLDAVGRNVTYSADGPVARATLALDRGANKLGMRVEVDGVPPWLKFTQQDDLVEFDARASAGAAEGSAAVGRVHAALATDGLFLGAQPAEDHVSLVQTATQARVDLAYGGLAFARADLRNREFHLDLRNTADRVFRFSLDTPRGLALGLLDRVPASVRVDAAGGRFALQASAPVSAFDLDASDRKSPALNASLRVRGIPASMALHADMARRLFDYQASAPLASLRLDASVPANATNVFRVNASLAGIPAAWTARFADGDVAFDAAQPLGSFVLDLANQPAAFVPASCRAQATRACVYANAVTQVYDLSLALKEVRRAAFRTTPEGSEGAFEGGARARLAVSANVYPATDLRGTLSATVDPLPASLTLRTGPRTEFRASENFDLSARASFGEPKAIGYAAEPPVYALGVAVRDGFSTQFDAPGTALKVSLELTGVPTSFSVDTRTQRFELRDWRPKSTFLTVDVQLSAPKRMESLERPHQLPFGNANHGAVWDGKHAYIFGGFQGFVCCNVFDYIFRYNPNTGNVTVLPTKLPGGVGTARVVWTGEFAFVFGNTDGRIFRFDPADETVREMDARLPSRAAGQVAAAYDGRYVFLFGGREVNDGMRTIYRYDPEEDSLKVLPETLYQERYNAEAVFDGRDIYIFGGCQTVGCRVQRYTPATGQSVQLQADFAASGMAPVWTGTHIVLFGGNGYGCSNRLCDQIRHYDRAKDQFVVSGARLASGREGTATVWTGTDVLVFGGQWNYFSAYTMTEIFRYNPTVPGPKVEALVTVDKIVPTPGAAQTLTGSFRHTESPRRSEFELTLSNPLQAATVRYKGAGSLDATLVAFGVGHVAAEADGDPATDFAAKLVHDGALTNVVIQAGLKRLDLDNVPAYMDFSLRKESLADRHASEVTRASFRHNGGGFSGSLAGDIGTYSFNNLPRSVSLTLETGIPPQTASGGGWCSTGSGGGTPTRQLRRIGAEFHDTPGAGAAFGYTSPAGALPTNVQLYQVTDGKVDLNLGSQRYAADLQFAEKSGGMDVVVDGISWSVGKSGCVEGRVSLDLDGVGLGHAKVDAAVNANSYLQAANLRECARGCGSFSAHVDLTLWLAFFGIPIDLDAWMRRNADGTYEIHVPKELLTQTLNEGDWHEKSVFGFTVRHEALVGLGSRLYLPVPLVAPVFTASCAGGIGSVPLDARPSYDLDGDALAFAWSPAAGSVLGSGSQATGRFPLGTTAVDVDVNDGVFGAQRATFRARVEDVVPPVTAAAVAGTQLPNGTWSGPVQVTLTPTDACGVDATRLSLDGAPWVEGVSMDVAARGNHTLRWASTDLGGNVEPVKGLRLTLA